MDELRDILENDLVPVDAQGTESQHATDMDTAEEPAADRSDCDVVRRDNIHGDCSDGDSPRRDHHDRDDSDRHRYDNDNAVSRPAATLFAAFLALALTACGGGSSGPTGALQETSDKLGDIRSGDLTLRMHVEGGGKQAGFELQGRFALADEGELPVADLDYTQIAGDKEETVRLISTGEKAFVAIGNDVYELPEKQTASLRSAGGQVSGDSGLGSLDIGGWLIQPRLSDGGEVGGAETDRIQADLDVVRAANDILALVGRARRQASHPARRQKRRAASRRHQVCDHRSPHGEGRPAPPPPGHRGETRSRRPGQAPRPARRPRQCPAHLRARDRRSERRTSR